MNGSTRVIECETHGTQIATYVCKHIVETLREWKAARVLVRRVRAWCSLPRFMVFGM